MPLRVIAGPGCDAVGKDDYLEDALEEGDIVISVGKIFQAITASTDIPSSNSAALRLSLYLRTTAIRQAREKELNGFVLTSERQPCRSGSVGRRNRRARCLGHQVDRAGSVRACRGAGPKGCSAAGVRGRDQAALVRDAISRPPAITRSTHHERC